MTQDIEPFGTSGPQRRAVIALFEVKIRGPQTPPMRIKPGSQEWCRPTIRDRDFCVLSVWPVGTKFRGLLQPYDQGYRSIARNRGSATKLTGLTSESVGTTPSVRPLQLEWPHQGHSRLCKTGGVVQNHPAGLGIPELKNAIKWGAGERCLHSSLFTATSISRSSGAWRLYLFFAVAGRPSIPPVLRLPTSNSQYRAPGRGQERSPVIPPVLIAGQRAAPALPAGHPSH
jgi:hypothetical protein